MFKLWSRKGNAIQASESELPPQAPPPPPSDMAARIAASLNREPEAWTAKPGPLMRLEHANGVELSVAPSQWGVSIAVSKDGLCTILGGPDHMLVWDAMQARKRRVEMQFRREVADVFASAEAH
jgi:hypothetical protein